MFLLLFICWIVFNGKITLEILLIGAAVTALVYAFMCKFLSWSLKKDWYMFRLSGFLIEYLFVLLIEILKANIITARHLLSYRNEVEPVIVEFSVPLKTEKARVMLANSITLTPGTITVRLKDNNYTVHCLDNSLAEGIDNSIFVKLLMKMEAISVDKEEK